MPLFFIIYKITNKLNAKYYIGMHKTKNLNDGYMGSGKLITLAIKKYGIENFTKEILFIFNNEIDMKNKEKELVVVSENTYNLCYGGQGGFGHIHKMPNHKENCRKGGIIASKNFVEKFKTDNEFKEKVLNYWQKKGIEASKKYWKNLYEKYKLTPWTINGSKHSDETKRIIGLKSSKHQSGKGNSQYNTIWITDGRQNKKIKKEDKIPDGFRKGRVIKNKI